jgi:hypothetical protein
MAAASAIKDVEPADIAINGEAVKLAGKTLLCAVWFVPAIMVNVDSAQGQGIAWTACAVGSVIGGGACVIVARPTGKSVGRGA